MRQILYSIFMILAAGAATAQTSITDPSVSGHWTIDGSPYQINTNIYIGAGSELTIDPGVEVVFEGSYPFTVFGTLKAVGTPDQPILFHVSDTTGWSDLSTSSGGWGGISFTYQAVPDSTIMNYCKIYDMKGGIGVARPVTISNTEIYHCTSSGSIVSINTYSGLCIVDGCNIHDNRVPMAAADPYLNIFYTSNLDGDVGLIQPAEILIENSQIHDNTANGVLYGTYCNMIFQNNSLYNNTTNDEGTLELLYEDSVYITGNKIYNNVSNGLAAVHANCSIVTLTDNYICNNQNIAAACSATEGGGGLHLATNGDVGTTRYVVRNNIIANNSAPFGAGMYMYHAGAAISNNAFVNNTSSTWAGAAITIDDTWNTSVIKNNIFFHNEGANVDTGLSIFSEEGGYYYFDNNYIEHGISSEILSLSTLNLEGDTTENIVGTNPMFKSMVAVGDTISALAANFDVDMASSCVNAGDSVYAQAYTTDYAGNPRVAGGRIDIGPYECTNCGTAEVATAQPRAAFHVFPNPTSGQINILLPHTGGMLTVADMTGRVVSTYGVSAQIVTLDLSNLPSGAYLVNWLQEGQTATAQKIILN